MLNSHRENVCYESLPQQNTHLRSGEFYNLAYVLLANIDDSRSETNKRFITRENKCNIPPTGSSA